ncbi:MAG: DUF2953 domain-containing protein [Boseongicola sp.]|nr:DUF2953 domain-containing protein [Boseongicola sp.]
MSIAISVLLWGLGLCLGAVLLVIAMPVRLEIDVQKGTRWRFRAALRPFGRFGPRLPLSGRKGKTDKPPEKRRKRNARRRLGKMRIDRLAQAGAKLVGDILRCVRIETATLQMRFGLGDPAETGEVFGYMAPVIYGAGVGQKLSFDVEPVFDRAVLEGQAKLDLSLVPAALLGPLFRFGWTVFGPVR